jgi:hypothetical protein
MFGECHTDGVAGSRDIYGFCDEANLRSDSGVMAEKCESS